VNVNELLAIINNWGACPTVTLCTDPQVTHYDCPADVAPYHGDGVVNVNDLLAIILNWGSCSGGGGGGMPQSVSDCFNNVCNELSGEDWQKCMNACIDSVCERNPSECE
jgi:hypothetical protein